MRYMFYDCISLKQITLPSILQTTDVEGAFFGCYGLKSVTVPYEDPTQSTIAEAFNDYTNAILRVPEGTKDAYRDADGWNQFEYIYEIGEPVPYAEMDESTGTLTFIVGDMDIDGNTYTIGSRSWKREWYSEEDDEWYNNYDRIKKVVFDASFSDFSPTSTEYWFAFCSNIESIEGLEYLNTAGVTSFSYMFQGCSSLISLDLSNFEVNTDEMYQLIDGCSSLRQLTLPSNMAELFGGIFGGCNMINVTSLIADPSTVPFSQYAFDSEVYETVTLYVPAGTKALYEAADGWKLFLHIEEIGNVQLLLAKDMVTYTSKTALDFSTPVEGLTAYTVSSVNNDGKAVLSEVTSVVPAGTGLVLIGTEGQTYELPTATTSGPAANNMMVGVTVDTAIGGNDVDYILKDGKFVKALAGTLKAGKAYLKLNTALARETIDIEGVLTSISEAPLVVVDESKVYNLNGQRVGQSHRKGLYIVNGKKVIK